MDIQHLAQALVPLLRDPVAEDSFAYGLAALPAVGDDVMVNVDPELEDRADVTVEAMVDRVGAFLAMSPEQWEQVLADVVAEVDDAVGEQVVVETTALRDDLALTSSVVFVDAVLLSFVAPLQFPDGVIRVQLDTDLAFEDIDIEGIEVEGIEQVAFDGLDDLIDHLGQGS